MHHLRREQGGQGKAHTLNHGITQILADAVGRGRADHRCGRALRRQRAAQDGAASLQSRRRRGDGLHQGRQHRRQLPHPVHRLRVHHRAGGGAPGAERAGRAWPASPAAHSFTRARTSRRSAAASTPRRSRKTPLTTFRTQLLWEERGVRGQRHRVGRGARRPRRAVEAAAALGPRQRADLSAVLQHVAARSPLRQAGPGAVRLDLVLGRADAGLHGGRVERADRPPPAGPPEGMGRVPPAVEVPRRRLPFRHGDVVRARSVHGAAGVGAGHPLPWCDLAGDHRLQHCPRSRSARC